MLGWASLRGAQGETQPGCLEVPFGGLADAGGSFSSGLSTAAGGLSGSEGPRTS